MEPKITIIQDTREKHGYDFPGSEIVKLGAGDYGIKELPNQVAVERKSLEDFVSTVVQDWERFVIELKLLVRHKYACIVVEGSVQDILENKFRSNVSAKVVLAKVFSISSIFRIPVFFCGDRQHARFFTENFLRSAAKRLATYGS